MKAVFQAKRIVAILAWILGAVFVYSGITKSIEPAGFAEAVGNYRILPWYLINLAAIFLPWWEIAPGLALFFPSWRRPAAKIILILTGLFTIAVVTALIRGLDISCGCFGEDSSRVGLRTLLIDIGILLAGGMILRDVGGSNPVPQD
jgi:uncharacterized membrane protein YphA (DoxX/SURF4 family)